jgi:hypothetical protein
VLRLSALAALTLGTLFWTGHADQLHEIHMLIGVVLVLSLWAVAFPRLASPGGVRLTAGAVGVSVVLFVVGVTQERILPGASHWVNSGGASWPGAAGGWTGRDDGRSRHQSRKDQQRDQASLTAWTRSL